MKAYDTKSLQYSHTFLYVQNKQRDTSLVWAPSGVARPPCLVAISFQAQFHPHPEKKR